MPCERVGNSIFCSNNRRDFLWDGEIYFIEEGGWGRGICDEDGNEVEWWNFEGDKLNRFEAEINKNMEEE